VRGSANGFQPAMVAKMPKITRPTVVVVSIRAPWPVSTLNLTRRSERSCTLSTRRGQGPAQTVEFADDQDIVVCGPGGNGSTYNVFVVIRGERGSFRSCDSSGLVL
jgi:hypothetical protein